MPNDVEVLVNLWNKNIGDDFPMTRRLFIQNSIEDLNVVNEASFCAIVEGKTVGFIVSKTYQEPIEYGQPKNIGWIQVLIVDKHYRNRGIGTKLLNSALNQLKQLGIDKIHLGRDVWHYFPGVPLEYEDTINWFLKKGFKKREYIDVDLVRHFKDDEPLELIKNNDAHFSILNINEKDHLLKFLKEAFYGRWFYETIKYFELGGTGRDYVVYWVDGEIKGFCRMNDDSTPFIGCNVQWAGLYDEKTGGIGPLGIHPNYRKLGLGLDIVKYAVNTLHNRGCRHIVIDWTGLVSFYEKIGFSVYKQYVPLSIDL